MLVTVLDYLRTAHKPAVQPRHRVSNPQSCAAKQRKRAPSRLDFTPANARDLPTQTDKGQPSHRLVALYYTLK